MDQIANFSDYVVFIDESGDHGLESIDKNYPIFVLAFSIYKIHDYIHQACSAIDKIKFKYFGHNLAILHERDIRRDLKDFKFLKNCQLKNQFLSELTQAIDFMDFTMIACVIKKDRYIKKYPTPQNPYDLALKYGLESIHKFLKDKGQESKRTQIIIEERGVKEDNELELEFRRVIDGQNTLGQPLNFGIQFSKKIANSIGLQISDLCARPIGLHVLKPAQSNQAFQIIEKKLYIPPDRPDYSGYGLKIFP